MSEYPSWARGFKLDELRAQTELFRAHDKGLVLGAFSGIKDRDVAAWRAKRQVAFEEREGKLVAAVAWTTTKADRFFPDFAGRSSLHLRAGSLVVQRLAFARGSEALAAELLHRALQRRQRPVAVVESWVEHAGERALLERLGGRLVGTKITAASELRGFYAFGPPAALAELPSLPPQDERTLCRLRLPAWERGWMGEVAAKVEREVTAWADHYAPYNKGHTWKAVALRGYGGRTDFIEKPAEMSRGWQEANGEKLRWELAWTPLWGKLQEWLAPLVASVPAAVARVRLMQLLPGGVIGRHADITDPTAGTTLGHTLRVHIPLATEEACRFVCWSASGERLERHMGLGETWYIDTRKPHSVVHTGSLPRVHLVMDAYSSPELLALLPAKD